MAYADPDFFIGGTAGVSFNKVATKSGRDRGNIQSQIQKKIRNGEPLTPKLESALFDALRAIHEEARLHSYPVRIMGALRTLRVCEQEARRSIADLEADASPYQIEASFVSAFAKITDPFMEVLVDGLALVRKDETTDEDRVTIYLAAAILHTLVELWEEAATCMMRAEPSSHPDDLVLHFEHVGIEGVSSVFDVAEKSFDLYEEIDATLNGLNRSLDRNDPLRKLIDQDRRIAGINMASLSSYGFDWQSAEDAFARCFGVGRVEATTRARNLAARGKLPLDRSTALLETHPEHMLLARNLLYMALQQEDGTIESKIRDHIAGILQISGEDVYSVRLADRKPLIDEPHLKRFSNTNPNIKR